MPVKQSQTDLSMQQSGSERVHNPAFVLGARSARPTTHGWQGFRRTLMGAKDTNYLGWFDDFLGDSVNSTYTITGEASTDGSLAIASSQANGVARIATSPTGAADGDFLNVGLNTAWVATAGYIFFDTRVKVLASNITYVTYEIGLADASTYTNGNCFTNWTTGAATSGADAVLFSFNENASGDTTYWKVLGANNGTNTLNTTTTVTPTADTWYKLSLIVDTSGYVWAYINDTLVASYTSAATFTTSAPLTPYFGVVARSAAAKAIDVDYVSIVGTRS